MRLNRPPDLCSEEMRALLQAAGERIAGSLGGHMAIVEFCGPSGDCALDADEDCEDVENVEVYLLRVRARRKVQECVGEILEMVNEIAG